MKISEVTVTSGVTVSFTKYRFVRLEYTMGATLSEGEDPMRSMDTLRGILRKKLAKDAREEVLAWRKLGAQVEALGDTPEPTFDFD